MLRALTGARIKGQLVEIRDVASVEQAQEKVHAFVDEHEREFPEACSCVLDDVEASLNHLKVPLRHRAPR